MGPYQLIVSQVTNCSERNESFPAGRHLLRPRWKRRHSRRSERKVHWTLLLSLVVRPLQEVHPQTDLDLQRGIESRSQLPDHLGFPLQFRERFQRLLQKDALGEAAMVREPQD